jgi:hypothetical protein
MINYSVRPEPITLKEWLAVWSHVHHFVPVWDKIDMILLASSRPLTIQREK